jgi:hypothetical protein
MTTNTEEITCSICLSEVTDKKLTGSIQFDCMHYYHTACIKKWCSNCVERCTKPICPCCREPIANEYLDILNIHFVEKDSVSHKARVHQLYSYIVREKINQNEEQLKKILETNPDEAYEVLERLFNDLMREVLNR